MITAIYAIITLVLVVFVRPALMNAPVGSAQGADRRGNSQDATYKGPSRQEVYKEIPLDENWRSTATRKLVLKRKKTVVGSAGKLHVFLGDNQGNFIINGIKCTEIGVLKNGETGEYDIPTESVYIFVTTSKAYAEERHSVIQVPRGEKNVELFTSISMEKGKFEIFTRQDLMDLGKTGKW